MFRRQMKNFRRRILFLFTILITLFILYGPGFFAVPYAGTAYAASGFILGPGNPKVQGAYNVSQNLYWKSVSLQVNEKGEFNFSGNWSGDTSWQEGFVRKTAYDIQIEGNYDSKQGAFSGNFSTTGNWTETENEPDGRKFISNGSDTFSGSSINGQMKPGDESVTLSFSGKLNSQPYAIQVIFPIREIKPSSEGDTDKETPTHEADEDSNSNQMSSSKIKGDVGFSKDGETWIPLTEYTTLKIQDSIKTGPKSFAEIKYSDGSYFRIKPNSEVRILSDGLYIKQGETYLYIKKKGKAFFNHIRTGEAFGSVLGTTFVVSERDNTTILKLIEGSIAFQSTVSGKTEEVSTGEMLIADKNGLRQKTTYDAEAENASWDIFPKDRNTLINSNNVIYFAIAAGVSIVLIIVAALTYRKKKA